MTEDKWKEELTTHIAEVPKRYILKKKIFPIQNLQIIYYCKIIYDLQVELSNIF